MDNFPGKNIICVISTLSLIFFKLPTLTPPAGPPAISKTAVCKLLKKYYPEKFTHVSIGNMVRAAANSAGASEELKRYVNTGELVPIDQLLAILRVELEKTAPADLAAGEPEFLLPELDEKSYGNNGQRGRPERERDRILREKRTQKAWNEPKVKLNALMALENTHKVGSETSILLYPARDCNLSRLPL